MALNRGSPHRDHVKRRWLERGVFVLAALASIATSPKRWTVQIDKLPVISDPGKTTLVVVESSERPEVMASSVQRSTELAAFHEDGQRRSYLVPAGFSIQQIQIRHTCHMGCNSEHCEPTRDDFVRLASATTVAMWRIEAVSKPISTTIGAQRPFPWFEIITNASLEPAITIATADDINPEIHGTGPHRLVLLAPIGTPRVQTATWTVHAMIEGPCPTSTPCEPPAGEHLTIESIEAKEPGFAP
jgi:hypothetical protein